jgi:hypothetical protein
MAGHLSAITAMDGPPTYPEPMQQIFTMVYVHFTCLLLCSLCNQCRK